MINSTFPEFPDYDDVLTIPSGWFDNSWCNNACPSISRRFNEDSHICIWCDYKDPTKRGDGLGSPYRFIVTLEDGIGEEYRGHFYQLEDALLFANALSSQSVVEG
jgi:hypothetical protein